VTLKKIKRIVQNYAHDVRQALPVQRVFLYGSYANGTATDLSDMDVCFFLNDFNGKTRTDIIIQLIEIGGKYKGVFFEPNVFHVSSLSNDNPFVKEILRTGVELPVSE
jgi:predicted nucleotidyltransferase